MIVHTDFPNFVDVTREIDRALAYVNLTIHRLPEGEGSYSEIGVIKIEDRNSRKHFAGALCHEGSHLVTDPILYRNYVDGIHAIRTKLGINDIVVTKRGPMLKAQLLANAASDVICGFKISRNDVLNRHRAEGLRFHKENMKEMPKGIGEELLAIYGRLHGVPELGEPKLFDQAEDIIDGTLDRNRRYVELARLFLPLLDETLNQAAQNGGKLGDGEGEEQLVLMPIQPTGEEEEDATDKAVSQSHDVEEAEEKLKTCKAIGNESATHLLQHPEDLLIRFYESQARKTILSIEFPKEPTVKGVKIGSRKWKPQDGLRKINVKKTVIKHGVNIPLVTTQTTRILPKFLSDEKQLKPVDLVVSIDVSGSTGTPRGTMNDASDYEVTMFYALIALSKRVDQNIGYTLWENHLVHTTLPNLCDWREADNLKREILSRAWGGGTSIHVALRQANQHPKKLFFILTDGEVYHHELTEAPNCQFFLVKPNSDDEKAFVDKYGRDRVVTVTKLERLPRLVLTRWKEIFWT